VLPQRLCGSLQETLISLFRCPSTSGLVEEVTPNLMQYLRALRKAIGWNTIQASVLKMEFG